MSLVVTIDAMTAAGCSAEQIAAVVRAHAAVDDRKAAHRRQLAAERKRRQRAREDVTDVTHGHAGHGVTERDKSALGFPPQDSITLQPPHSSPENLSSTNGLNGHSIDPGEPIKPKKHRSPADLEMLLAVGEAWNAFAKPLRLPQIDEIKGARERSTLARCRDLVDVYGFESPLAGFQEIFTRIRGSPLLRGEKGDWRCNFDFVVGQSSFTKIMEGNYADQGKKPVGQFANAYR